MQASVIVIHQTFSDGSIVVTGIPVSYSSIKRWIYEDRGKEGISITIDIGMSRSIKLSGEEATEAHVWLLETFDRIFRVKKSLN
jgi:hypothetical protein